MRVPCCNCMPSGSVTRSTLASPSGSNNCTIATGMPFSSRPSLVSTQTCLLLISGPLPHTCFHGEYVNCGAAEAEGEKPKAAHVTAMVIARVMMRHIRSPPLGSVIAKVLYNGHRHTSDEIDARKAPAALNAALTIAKGTSLPPLGAQSDCRTGLVKLRTWDGERLTKAEL